MLIILSTSRSIFKVSIFLTQGALNLLQYAECNRLNPDMVVPEFKPILCQNLQLARSFNRRSLMNSSGAIKNLESSAKHFIENILHMNRNGNNSIKNYLEAAGNYKKDKGAKQKLQEFVNGLPIPQEAKLMTLSLAFESAAEQHANRPLINDGQAPAADNEGQSSKKSKKRKGVHCC